MIVRHSRVEIYNKPLSTAQDFDKITILYAAGAPDRLNLKIKDLITRHNECVLD